MLRSWLFVPADSERKLARSDESGADAVILDLEDAVMPERKAVARDLARAHLEQRADSRNSAIWVRVNPVDTPDYRTDLATVLPGRPDGIVLPKAESADDLARLSELLYDLEALDGLEPGSTRIMPVATETPAAVFQLRSYASSDDRLYGLTWGAEDLSVAVGALSNRNEAGCFTAPYEMVRNLCLFAAAAAGVAPVDTLEANFRDTGGFESLQRTRPA